jgi:hypothetical protein
MILALAIAADAFGQSAKDIDRVVSPCAAMIQRCTPNTCHGNAPDAAMKETRNYASGDLNQPQTLPDTIKYLQTTQARNPGAHDYLWNDILICLAQNALDVARSGLTVAPPPTPKPVSPNNASPGPSQFGSNTPTPAPVPKPAPTPTPPAPSPKPSQAELNRQARQVLDDLLNKGKLPDPTQAELRDEINKDDINKGENAVSCLNPVPKLNGGDDKVENVCDFRIQVVWCVEGVDCNPTFSNTNDMSGWKDKLKPAPYLLISGTSGSKPPFVNYGACKGGGSVVVDRGSKDMTYGCKPGQP